MGPTSIITPFSHAVRQGEESGAWREDATRWAGNEELARECDFKKSLFAAQLHGTTAITASLCACVRDLPLPEFRGCGQAMPDYSAVWFERRWRRILWILAMVVLP